MSDTCKCRHPKTGHNKDGCTHLNYGSGCEVHVCTCHTYRASDNTTDRSYKIPD